MKQNMLRYGRPVLAVTIALTMLGLAACASKTGTTPAPPTSGGQSKLALLQQAGNLSVRFYGMMTFDFAGTTVTFPSEFAVSSVPIDWEGRIFSGKAEGGGPGGDVTQQVHGSLSPDGEWVDSLSYSWQITRTANNAVTLRRVTLRNLPIVQIAGGSATELVVFEKAGADLQKHMERIEYVDGLLSGGKMVSTTTYVGTDWKNSNKGQVPTLKLVFATGTGDQGGPSRPARQPMMGQ